MERMRHLILIVDDDALMRRSMAFNLEQAGYKTLTAANAEDAFAQVQREKPDLVLLDIGLPGMDGLDALRKIKDQFDLPVIFVTARRKELDEVLGLELGADDYITKPFDINILLAHIKAVLRRSKINYQTKEPTAAVTVGELQIDPDSHTVNFHGNQVDLTPREFDLLYTLASAPGRVFSTDEILGRVWGAEYLGQPQVVYVHMRWLRKKLESDPDHPELLLTIRGVGYKLAAGK